MKGNPMAQSDYMRTRARSIGVTMIVMGASFFFYYLGLFGNVDGPLTPSAIGESLAGIGVSKRHMLLFFLSFFIISLVWNHLFNATAWVAGTRRTCTEKDGEGQVCGAPARKSITMAEGGTRRVRYHCAKGHACAAARFHPVKKGVVSHTVCILALMFCAIVMYCS